MLLHVIWGFVEETTQQCPTFSVTGVLVQCGDRTAAYAHQGRFQWRHDAWEADVEITGVSPSRVHLRGVLRLGRDVLDSWMARGLNPRTESARQLREAIQQRGTTVLGAVTLTV